MTCTNCTRSLQLVVHQEYTDRCVGCEARRVAYMPSVERERYYDRVQHLGGPGDRAEAIKVVNLERARIAALKQAQAGRMVT